MAGGKDIINKFDPQPFPREPAWKELQEFRLFKLNHYKKFLTMLSKAIANTIENCKFFRALSPRHLRGESYKNQTLFKKNSYNRLKI
jgi:hypothetical protein